MLEILELAASLVLFLTGACYMIIGAFFRRDLEGIERAMILGACLIIVASQ